MNIIPDNKNKSFVLISNIEKDITSITDQISSLKFIEINHKNELSEADLGLVKSQIKDLTDQESKLKTRIIQLKCELLKVDLEDNIKSIKDRISHKTAKLASNENEILQQKTKLADLESSLASLKWISENEPVDVKKDLEEQNQLILQCKQELAQLENNSQKIIPSIKKNVLKVKILKCEIFNVEEMARLKNNLIDCKSRLKELHLTQVNNKEAEDNLRLEMKGIIKEMIHSRSFLCLQLELKKLKDYLANLIFLGNEGEKVEETEIERVKLNIELIEKQVEHELMKAELLGELKDAQLTLLNLNPFIGRKDLEDVNEPVRKASLKIIELTNKITKITVQSISVAKSLNERAAKKLSENVDPVSPAPERTPSAMNIIVEELQKWLSENILEETLSGDIQESIVTIAALKITKTKLSHRSAQETENEGVTQKIKNTVIGACEKFCMGQVVEQIVGANPLVSAAYALGIVVQHYVLDDGQLSTLKTKLKKFAIGESIKTAGNLAFGTAIAGTIGSGLAISASTYLAYSIISEWYAGHAKSDNDPTNDLSSAGIEMIADATVNTIFQSIFA